MQKTPDFNYKSEFILKVTEVNHNFNQWQDLHIELVNLKPQINSFNVYQEQNEKDVFLVISTTDGDKPIYKNYLTQDKYSGFKVLGDFNIKVNKSGMKSLKSLFDAYNLQHIYGDSEQFDRLSSVSRMNQTFTTELNKVRVNSKEQLLIEFIAGYVEGRYKSVEQFYRENAGNYQAMIEIANLENKMKQHVRLIRESKLTKQEYIHPIKSLKQYVDNKIRRLEQIQVREHEQFEYLGYGELVDQLYKVMIKKECKKKNSLWIVDDTNTGKTTVCEMLKEIFICDILEDGVSHFYVKVANLESVPQISLMDEMNHPYFFSKKGISKMKKILEGKGYAIDEKYGQTKMAFKNTSVIITTNDTPFESFKKVDQDALMERIILCKLELKSKMSKEIFPKTALDLAHYMYNRYLNELDQEQTVGYSQDTKQQLQKGMEYIDNSKMSENQSMLDNY